MVEKSGSIAKRLSDSELATSIVESANQIWLAGLGAFAMAHEEGGSAFDKFVKHGKDDSDRAGYLNWDPGGANHNGGSRS